MLKRFCAILLLFIFLFNLYGYKFVIDYLQNRQETKLELQLDNEEYNNEDLISFKLPVNLPYYTNSQNYERTNGSIEINGIEYKYVKKRIYKDSIELLCISSSIKKYFQNAKDEFFQLCFDLKHLSTSNKKNTPAPVAKNLQLEYCYSISSLNIAALLPENIKHNRAVSIPFSTIYLSSEEQPPKVLSYC